MINALQSRTQVFCENPGTLQLYDNQLVLNRLPVLPF
jgi:hypothetical protein